MGNLVSKATYGSDGTRPVRVCRDQANSEVVMKISGFAVAAVAGLAIGAASSAEATPIPLGSQLSLSGNADLDGTAANPTVNFTFANPAMNNTGAFLTALGNTGSSLMINQGTTIPVANWPTTTATNYTCDGGQVGCMYHTVAGNGTGNIATFNLTSETFTNTGGFLDVMGTGTVRLTGFDPTPANFLLTAQGTGPVTFSATTVAVPGPIVGAGLPGLIAALGGLVALARRRRKQLA